MSGNASAAPSAASTAPTPTAADWLVASAVLVVVPLLRDLPLWVGAGYFAAVTWRFMHTHFRWRQPGRFARWVLAGAAVVLVYRHYGTLLGRDPGVALLVLLTGFKLLELGTMRDAALAALLLLLIVLGGFLYGTSLVLGLYTLAAVLGVTAALVRLQHASLKPVAVGRFACMLVAQALPLMLVAYFLFPRLPDAMWGLEANSTEASTGMPEQMRPGNISSLSRSDAVAFRAYFEESAPPSRELYWRIRVFWDTDGQAWEEGPPFASRNALRVTGDPVSYRLVLEPTERPWLPVLDLPVVAPPAVRSRAGFIYEAPRARRERQTFDFISHTRYQTGPLSDVERGRALALPESLSERVRRLAESWRAGARQDADTVRAALAYFNREPFVYTLTPPLLGRDPVDQFLFETRRGFCEHYASAFVTLMRAAGVPARVVVGYQGGIHNPAGDYLIVRQADAHAWAEVWLPHAGWTRVDPTAAIAPSRIEYGMDGVRRLLSQGMPLNSAVANALRAIQIPWIERAWLQTRLAWDYMNFSWYLWIGDYGLERQTRFLEQVGLTEWSVPVMVLILVQLVLLYALLQLRRRRPPRPRDLIRRHYEKYCHKLARVGIVRGAAEGPIEFRDRARAQCPQLTSAIDDIVQRYVALRYGRADNNTARRDFARAVREFRARLDTSPVLFTDTKTGKNPAK